MRYFSIIGHYMDGDDPVWDGGLWGVYEFRDNEEELIETFKRNAQPLADELGDGVTLDIIEQEITNEVPHGWGKRSILRP